MARLEGRRTLCLGFGTLAALELHSCIASGRSTGLTWLFTDHLGSTVKAVDAVTGASQEMKYAPWGATRSGSLPTTFRFTGQRAEPGLDGIHYYGARWYDAALGRFLSPDTIVPSVGEGNNPNAVGYVANATYSALTVDYHENQFLEQINQENHALVPINPLAFDRYAYVFNSPIRYTDPTGHIPACDRDDWACQTHWDDPVVPSWQELPDDKFLNGYSEEYGICIYGNCSGGLSYYEENYATDFAVLGGFNGSASTPGISTTGGVEGILIMKDGTTAAYTYGGQGNSYGAGANLAVYGGMSANVKTPDDYKGISAAVGATVSIGDVGVTASYFWNGNYAPFTPGVVQGFQLGYAPGAKASLWYSNVVYNMFWSSK